jgi:hypothetical protein
MSDISTLQSKCLRGKNTVTQQGTRHMKPLSDVNSKLKLLLSLAVKWKRKPLCCSCLLRYIVNTQFAFNQHCILYQWYSTFFVSVPPDIISLQLFTPKVVGV